MGTSLFNTTPAATYPALIKVGNNTSLDGTLKVLSDGLGTNLPMEASTTAINFTGVLTQAGTTLQPTLVSGTNIKTINSTSLLGSGDIVTPQPSGVAGAIQFSNGSAFASDASNLFWDDTNNRLGIGTATPSNKVHFITDNCTSATSFSNQISLLAGTQTQGLVGAFSTTDGATLNSLWPGNAWLKMNYGGVQHLFGVAGTTTLVIDSNSTLGNGTTSLNARWGIKGSGATSATTSLLVQNSAATALLNVRDNGSILINGLNGSGGAAGQTNFESSGNDMSFKCSFYYRFFTSDNKIIFGSSWDGTNTFAYNENRQVIGANAINSTAQFQIDSTTRGFLPPRMTTTQKNAIASPATGLIVMDITTFKLCVYNGTSWVDLH